MQEMKDMQVRSLGRENCLDEGMETHSSILAWRILRTEEPDGLQSIESQRVGHDKQLSMHAVTVYKITQLVLKQ